MIMEAQEDDSLLNIYLATRNGTRSPAEWPPGYNQTILAFNIQYTLT
jgi:hypothetical protein